MIFIGSACLICIVDLVFKYYVETHAREIEGRKIWNGKITLHKTHNKGMMLNFLDGYPAIVRGISGAAGIILGGYYFWQVKQPGLFLKKLGLTFMVGGAASNIYDRFVRRYVVDYISFKTNWKKFNRVVYNIGDLFIFLGCMIVIIAQFVRRKQ